VDADDADVHEMFEQLEKYVANIFAQRQCLGGLGGWE